MRLKFYMGLIIMLVFITGHAQAQEDLAQDFTPKWNFFPSDSSILDLRRRFIMWVPKARIENRAAKAFFAEHMRDKSKFIHKMDSLELLMATDPMTVLLNEMADHIVQHNDSLKGHKFQIYTVRSPVSNAYSIGEGVILISTSLLSHTTAIDQVAFILAHEMCHDIQNHVFSQAVSYSEGLFDGELRKEVRQARRNPVGRQSAIKEIMQGFLAEHMQYSRVMEFEADSLGFVYATNAGFDPHAAGQMLLMMEDVTDFSYPDTLSMADVFHFDEYPFQEYWLLDHDHVIPWEADSTVLFGPDSLRTHPDMKDRVARLNALALVSSAMHSGDSAMRERFAGNMHLLDFELVSGLLQAGDNTEALFVSLHLLKQYPHNLFIHCTVAYCLQDLRRELQKGKYLDVVDFPRLVYSEDYNRMLTFLHHMNSDMLTRLYELYSAKHVAGHPDHPYVVLIKHLSDPELLTQEMVDQYGATYEIDFFKQMLERRFKEIRKNKRE